MILQLGKPMSEILFYRSIISLSTYSIESVCEIIAISIKQGTITDFRFGFCLRRTKTEQARRTQRYTNNCFDRERYCFTDFLAVC